MTWHVTDYLRRKIEENIREGREPLFINLRAADWTPDEEFQSQPRRGTIKNGFVGPMNHYSRSMRGVLSLNPSEWRRL